MRLIPLTALLFLSFTGRLQAAELSWQMIPPPAAASEITALHAGISEQNTSLLAAAGGQLYSRQDNRWASLLRTAPARIREIRQFHEVARTAFVLTDRSAVLLNSAGPPREIFPADGRNTPVLSWAVFPEDPEHWLAGTEEGLFETDDAGLRWSAFPFRIQEPVIGLHFLYARLWIVTPRRVYVTHDLKNYREVFALSAASREDTDPAENLSPAADENPALPAILTSASSAGPAGGLWLGTRRGVFALDAESGFWSRLPGNGLPESSVSQLRYSPADQRLWAGTKEGLYEFRAALGAWQTPDSAPFLGVVSALELLDPATGKIACASSRGLFVFSPSPQIEIRTVSPEGIPENGLELLRILELAEPSVREIQAAALRASNSGQQKIRRWHFQSRIRSLLPSVSFGKDFSRGNNIDIDRGGTGDPDTYIVGPDQQSRGWDADVSWDLGDMIWSSAQTSIDSRDKINAEFRNDLLAEVTRLYYERRRLQFEIAASLAQNSRELLESKIHLEEVTALIDALTDGYLSAASDHALREYPELSVFCVSSRFS